MTQHTTASNCSPLAFMTLWVRALHLQCPVCSSR